MPLSFMYLEKSVLSNPWINPIGSNSFNWHGFIHPLAVSVVSIGNGWHAVNSGIIVLGVLAFSLFVTLDYVYSKYPPFTVSAAILVVSMIISFSGRPETTVAILCMLLYCTVRWAVTRVDPLRQRVAWVLSGVLTGTIAAANPNALPAVVFAQICLISAIYGIRDKNIMRLCVSLTVILVTSMFWFLSLLLFVYPLSGVEWINGIVQAAHKSAFPVLADTGDYAKNLLFSKDVPLIVLYSWFLVPIGWALHRLILAGENKLLGYFTFASFMLAASFMLRGLSFAFGRYNFTVFVPTLLLIVGSLLSELRITKYRQVTLYLCYGLAITALSTQFIWAYQNMRSMNNVPVYDDRLNHILSKAVESGLNVGVNSSILTAVDNADQLKKVRVIVDDSEADSKQFDLVILSQNEHPSERPIQLKNFEIIDLEYDPCCSLFFPRPLNNAFAAYRSLDRAPFRADD